MVETIQFGPSDNKQLPKQSLGLLFYNEFRKKPSNKTVVVDGLTGEEITYGNLLKLSTKLAAALKRIGVKRGDVVTIVSQNNWRYLITILAGLYIGAKINLFNHDYTSGELKHFLSISCPVLLFCTSKTLNNVQKLKDEIFFPSKIIIYDSESSSDVKSFEDILNTDFVDETFTPVEQDLDEVALMITSSGTTGVPKIVQLSHTNFRTLLITALDPLQVSLAEHGRIVGFLPFFHIFGCGVLLAAIFHNKIIIMERFVPDKFLQIVQDHKVTTLFTVPPILLFLIKSPLVDKYDCSSIKDILCGAASVQKELEDAIKKKFNVETVRQIYGMTELSGVVCVVPKKQKRSGSVGKVTTNNQIKVCDPETGKTLGANQAGELLIKGDGVMKGYLGNQQLTEEAFDEGYFRSGDLGYYDEDGYFYIVGRLKEIIKYKGFQVAPAELENLLIQHPAVKEAAVIAVPDEKAGEVPLAFVVKQPNQNVSEEELVQYVEENISIQKRLYGGVRFLDIIPKNSSGKVLKMKLKELMKRN